MIGATALGGACGRSSFEPLLTYYNGDYALSVRYPAGWRAEQAEQEGVFYRYFLGPPGPDRKPTASATLLVGRAGATIEEYEHTYLAGNTSPSSREEERQGAKGKSFSFASADGTMRYSLLLVEEKGRVYGLYSQSEAASFERHAPLLAEMQTSFTLERPASYREQRNDTLGYSLRIPASWRETRRFTGGDNALVQYTSPALAADKSRETVHASLSLTVERAPGDGSLEAYYQSSRSKLGDSFLVLDHEPWRGGYLDRLRTETPMAVSQVKRFYRTETGRAYSLTLEARDDVFPRVSPWYDLIAATLRTGRELKTP